MITPPTSRARANVMACASSRSIAPSRNARHQRPLERHRHLEDGEARAGAPLAALPGRPHSPRTRRGRVWPPRAPPCATRAPANAALVARGTRSAVTRRAPEVTNDEEDIGAVRVRDESFRPSHGSRRRLRRTGSTPMRYPNPPRAPSQPRLPWRFRSRSRQPSLLLFRLPTRVTSRATPNACAPAASKTPPSRVAPRPRRRMRSLRGRGRPHRGRARWVVQAAPPSASSRIRSSCAASLVRPQLAHPLVHFTLRGRPAELHAYAKPTVVDLSGRRYGKLASTTALSGTI